MPCHWATQPRTSVHTRWIISSEIAPCRRTSGGSTEKSTTVEGASCAPQMPSTMNPRPSLNSSLTSVAVFRDRSPDRLADVPVIGPPCTRRHHLRQFFDSSEDQSQRARPERTCKSGSSGGHRCGDRSQIFRPSYQQGNRAVCGPAFGGKQPFNRYGVKRIDTESVKGIGWKCDHSPTSYNVRRQLH